MLKSLSIPARKRPALSLDAQKLRFFQSSRQESNLHLSLRRAKFYPLNYERFGSIF